MKRFLSFLLILLMAITPTGCISGGGGGGDSGGPSGGGSAALDKSDVTLVFNLGELLAMNSTNQDVMLAKIIDFITMAKTCYAANLYDYITTLYIKVTGSGMTDIIREVEVDNPSSTFSITLTVLNGSNRNFEVKLKDRNGNTLYSGDLNIDVGNGGASQDITIDVNINEGITAEDYIEIGRAHLEDSELERAFIAFDTAVSIERNHPVANFFRGFTHLLLLVQKDDPDPDVDAASPNADITSMLNLYSNLDNIYLSSIAPDIYNEDYGTDLENFFDDDWEEPEDVTTDSTVNVIENVILPEIDNVINDLEKARSNSSFSTTLTTDMYFDISSTIKVDRADACILEAIAYGLKAYYNHILAYQLSTSMDWWETNLDSDSSIYDPASPTYIGHPYAGVQDVIDRDNDGVGELVGGAAVYLGRARSAYSSGLDRLKSGLQLIDRRSSVNKEDHIFNIADGDVNIGKIITNIDEVKAALGGPYNLTSYDDYEDTTTDADIVRLDLSVPFSADSDIAPSINSFPKFYYHSESGEDLPIFDTNNPDSSSDFIRVFTDIVKSINGTPIEGLEDILKEDLLPDYKFDVPVVDSENISVDGLVNDYVGQGISPVAFDEDEDEKPEGVDLSKVYMARDDSYLYIALVTRGTPAAGPFGEEDNFSYDIRFNARDSNCSWYSVPVSIELRWDQKEEGWVCRLSSYGSYPDELELDIDYAIGDDAVEFAIPLEEFTDLINEYQRKDPDEDWEWNEEEFFFAASVWSDVSFEGYGDKQYSDWVGEYLAVLNSGG